jgi:archaemetzincin
MTTANPSGKAGRIVILATLAIVALVVWKAAGMLPAGGPSSRPAPPSQAAGEKTTTSFAPATRPAKALSPEAIKVLQEKLRPLHQKLGKPGPSDWLAGHQEAGQTFGQYVSGDPVTLQGKRSVLYVQPLGGFTAGQRKIVNLAAEFVGLFHGCQVKVQEDLALSVIPAEARRTHPTWGVKQVLSTYVLDEVLRPTLPADAAARIAFTASDLWPGEGWNFVFGQASYRDRVGVWSLNRFGDADGNEAEFRLCLLRTMKTAVHEIGHMFSIQHCTAYECGMCGSNHLAEADGRPLEFCPECVAKLWWSCRCDPAARFRALADFCARQGLKAEAEFYEKSLRAIHP